MRSTYRFKLRGGGLQIEDIARPLNQERIGAYNESLRYFEAHRAEDREIRLRVRR